MMRIWFFSFIASGLLNAAGVSAPLTNVESDRASIEAKELKEGMSGVIVRHFDDKHSSIIANTVVKKYDPSTGKATLSVEKYAGLHQNSLPSGNWLPKVSDEAVIAGDYDRAMLIAPDDDAYYTITKSIPNVEWIHPDTFATYLSYEGHPTPLVEDFEAYCSAHSIGLLYIQSAQNLFTLDCKSFTLLETHASNLSNTQPQTPFYTRVPNIRAAWWGEGSSRLESYEPYYLEQIALNNSKNRSLYELYKAKFSHKSALLRNFEIKE